MTNLAYDHMSFNGYFRPTTPRLDALARESLVFDNAFAHASWTLPENMAIYTSLYPFHHGVMNRSMRLPEEVPHVLADGVALLSYEAHAIRANGEPFQALVSSAYVRTDGRWKMAFHQQTPLNAP